ncbi:MULTISPECIES: chromosome partitioning protein ParA [Vibrio]|uniref:Chromosome partitioning protein ParA n=2 Tax=Vibrio TaxID=662 RepID=A0A7X4LKF9_9VIBR|nr:chromosome partitioning protein ParA [Vibrio nitrifigilis]MBF9000450.1 chromosome partitioning protein ParA [Vibrio nitrifigilis]MZI93282.1 chromosome partitioning protein ParA [Vibrio eleionomae]
MDHHNNIDDNEDVVVIEQRDKRTYIYIGIAAVLGLALGGLIGSTLTSSKWQSAYDSLNHKYEQLTDKNSDISKQAQSDLAQANQQLQDKIDAAVTKATEDKQSQITKLEKEVAELEKVNDSLDSKVTNQKATLAKVDEQKDKLAKKANLQASVFERSREIFQKELKTKQELEKLQKERDDLAPKIKELKKACDLYLAGTSWDAKSDSCDKQDEAKARLGQLDQMIHVHQMDLKQMKALSEDIGLK